jgi:hypothetical protein
VGKLAFESVVLLAACGTGIQAGDAETKRRALAALRKADPIVKVDEDRPEKPVVSVQFRPNYAKVSDDDLVHLKAFPSLRCVELPNKSERRLSIFPPLYSFRLNLVPFACRSSARWALRQPDAGIDLVK